MRAVGVVCLLLAVGCVNRGTITVSTSADVYPQALPADGVSFATVAASIASGAGPIPADLALVLRSSDPSASITQFGSCDPSGWFHARISSTSSGTQTLTIIAKANAQSVTLVDDLLITFNAVTSTQSTVPSATTSWISANPNVVASDGQTSTVLTVHVLDGLGVPVPAAPITLTSTGTQNFLSATTGLTNSAGTFTATLASTVAETKTITAHAGSMAVSTDVTFLTSLPSALSTLQANPNTLTADGVSTSTLTLTVLDADGMPLAGEPVGWTSTGTNAVLTPGASTTDNNGAATATLSSTRAQNVTVTATSGALQLSQSVTFLAGSVSNAVSTFVANPNLLSTDGGSASALTFTALDAYGNPVPNQAVALSVTGSNNTLTPTSGTTNSSGVFFATLQSGKAETKTVTATSGSVVLNQNVTFIAGAANGSTSSLAAVPDVVTVSSGGNTITLTITLNDAQGNPVPGASVTFSATGSNNSFSQTTGATDATGKFSTTLSSTTVQEETVVVTYAGSGSSSTDVTFVAGAPSSLTTTLVASPNTVTANGTNTTTLSALVMDVFGNPVASQTVLLSASGSNNTITPLSGQTDASGVFTATMASSTAETKSVTLTAGSAMATTNVVFTVGHPSSSTTTFSASPLSVNADGTSTSTLTVTVFDVYNNPAPGVSVSIGSSGGNNVMTPSSGATNASGAFTATLTCWRQAPRARPTSPAYAPPT